MPDTQLQHIAIIMDGNRRWARERGMAAFEGHRAGGKALQKALLGCLEHKVPYCSVYAFSTENWKRTSEEVQYLMKLIKTTIQKSLDFFTEHDIRFRVIGDVTHRVDPALAAALRVVEEKTKKHRTLTFAMCFNYGGREEILNAVRSIITAGTSPEDVDEQLFAEHLYTHDLPDPDIVVRTSGEQRLSNFLPWQSVYSELFFMDMYWPDFDEAAIEAVIAEYDKRQRRFGG